MFLSLAVGISCVEPKICSNIRDLHLKAYKASAF